METTFSGSLLEAYCHQIMICTKIALTSIDHDRHKRPHIYDIIVKLIESENSVPNLEMDPRGKVYETITSMYLRFHFIT